MISARTWCARGCPLRRPPRRRAPLRCWRWTRPASAPRTRLAGPTSWSSRWSTHRLSRLGTPVASRGGAAAAAAAAEGAGARPLVGVAVAPRTTAMPRVGLPLVVGPRGPQMFHDTFDTVMPSIESMFLPVSCPISLIVTDPGAHVPAHYLLLLPGLRRPPAPQAAVAAGPRCPGRSLLRFRLRSWWVRTSRRTARTSTGAATCAASSGTCPPRR